MKSKRRLVELQCFFNLNLLGVVDFYVRFVIGLDIEGFEGGLELSSEIGSLLYAGKIFTMLSPSYHGS